MVYDLIVKKLNSGPQINKKCGYNLVHNLSSYFLVTPLLLYNVTYSDYLHCYNISYNLM